MKPSDSFKFSMELTKLFFVLHRFQRIGRLAERKRNGDSTDKVAQFPAKPSCAAEEGDESAEEFAKCANFS